MPRHKPRRSRSRSPLCQTENSEWISRTVAGFGRYPDKRPAGLHVDKNGALRLGDLMSTWGLKHGLKEDEVLHAVRAHMFHNGESGMLRFAIDCDSSQQILIRVMPKRGGAKPECATPMRAPWHAQKKKKQPALARGSVLREMSPHHLASSLATCDKLEMALDELESSAVQTPRVAKDKLEMSLDDLIRSERTGTIKKAYGGSGDANMRDAEDHQNHGMPSRPQWQKTRVHRAMEQMGLTEGTRHIRQRPGAWAQSAPAPRGDCHNSAAEKVQRWISWVLRSGHSQLNVPVCDGWVPLAALVVAMQKSRPGFGEFDGDKLRLLLENSDHAGRFELDQHGRLRKVPKGQRRPRTVAGPAVAAPSAAGPVAVAATGRGQQPHSASCSPMSHRQRRHASCSCSSERSLGGSGDVVMADAGSSPAHEPAPERRAPDRPPGDHWKQFQDEGRLWWHYDGPKGQWWCAQHAEPQPYKPEPA